MWRWLLLVACSPALLLAGEPIEYQVTSPGREAPPPDPVVVPYSEGPEAREVLIEKGPPPAPLAGEDAVFEQINEAPPLSRCTMEPGADCGIVIE